MRVSSHPSGHGLVNPYACGSGNHRGCSGFSGDYDTYLCGCCCHDLDCGRDLTDADRALVARVLGRSAAGEATT